MRSPIYPLPCDTLRRTPRAPQYGNLAIILTSSAIIWYNLLMANLFTVSFIYLIH